jgi:hypothetical protein
MTNESDPVAKAAAHGGARWTEKAEIRLLSRLTHETMPAHHATRRQHQRLLACAAVAAFFACLTTSLVEPARVDRATVQWPAAFSDRAPTSLFFDRGAH